MFKTVVLGLDGSPEAKQALPFALELAEPETGRIIAVHVRELLVGRAGGAGRPPPRYAGVTGGRCHVITAGPAHEPRHSGPCASPTRAQPTDAVAPAMS